MSQTDVRTGIDNFYTKDGSTEILVKNLCPLYANCTPSTVSNFSNTGVTLSGTPYFAGATIDGITYQPELWVVSHLLPYSSGGINQNFVKAGFKPQFTGNTPIFSSGLTTPEHTLLIRRHSDRLDFTVGFPGTVTSLYASSFKDRVLPNRLILLLQGAGGGGGGDFGSGGGSGGFLYIILNTSRTDGQFEITTGSGGTGGSGGSVFGGWTAGTNGGTSFVIWNPDSGIDRRIAEAYGGKGGASQGGAGGTGGGTFFSGSSLTLNVYYYRYYFSSTPSGFTSGKTGGLGSLLGDPFSVATNGQDQPGFTLHATHNPADRTGINNKSTGYKSGGTHSKGGGGAASVFRGGASGGPVFTAGNSANQGAGGGGGGNGNGAGGNGGPGAYEIYY
jgi:hypothetical protein